MRRRAVGLGLVVLSAVVLAACKNGDGPRLSAAQLTERGDAVCVTLDNDVKALADSLPVSITFTPDQMQDYYTRIVPLVDKAVASFKKLVPPKDLEAAYESALAQVDIDRKTLEGATRSPEAAKNLFDTRVDPFTATGQKLAAAGITACGGTAPSGSSSGSSTGGATSSSTSTATTAKPETSGSPTSAGSTTTTTTTTTK